MTLGSRPWPRGPRQVVGGWTLPLNLHTAPRRPRDEPARIQDTLGESSGCQHPLTLPSAFTPREDRDQHPENLYTPRPRSPCARVPERPSWRMPTLADHLGVCSAVAMWSPKANPKDITTTQVIVGRPWASPPACGDRAKLALSTHSRLFP